MLKIILITPSGAKVETVYANAQHYSLMHQRDGSHSIGVYDAKPQTTRTAMRAAGLLDDEDEDCQLTDEQKAALKPGNRLAMLYVAPGFCIEFDFQEKPSVGKTFAIYSENRDRWLNRRALTPEGQFVTTRYIGCEYDTSAEAEAEVREFALRRGRQDEDEESLIILDSDGMEVRTKTFAIFAVERNRWFNRDALGPVSEFVTVRSPYCEFATRLAAQAVVDRLRSEEEEGTPNEKFEILESDGGK